MAGFVIPYMIPLFLGMTFDARYSKPGVDIYDSTYVDNPAVTEYKTTESKYQVISSMSDVLKMLDVSGDLSLKIKTGMVDIKGKGSYLKNEREYENSVLVLTTMTYISVVKGLNYDAKPRGGWAKEYNTGVLGTHFVSSITYGAEMLASAKFVVHNSSDVSSVKGDVEAALGSGGTGTDLTANGKLDMLQEKVQGRASLEISFYGTVPLKSIPNTVEGLNTLVGTFGDQIKEAGLEDGIPMFAQLLPLEDIADEEDRDRFNFNKDMSLEAELSEFEEKLDELIEARQTLQGYAQSLPYELDDKYERQIGGLMQNITGVLQVFYDVLWKMDVTKGPEQLDPALKAYDYDDSMQARKYDRLVRKLKNQIKNFDALEDVFKIQGGSHVVPKGQNVGSDTYVHWGSNECAGNDTGKLFAGFTFSSAEEGIGGAASYSCSPSNIEHGYDLETEGITSPLAGIRYAEIDKDSNPFIGGYKDVSNKGVPCAKCYSPISSSITMFSALKDCPTSWMLVYRGYLMSSREKNGHTTEYICVDEKPSEPYEMDIPTRSANTLALTTVHSSGALPPEIYIEGALIKCVVCSMQNNQINF